MKAKSTLRSFLLAAGSSLLAVSYTHATTYYWDVNGNRTDNGFSTVVGAWNTGLFWNTNATGGTGGTITAATTDADDLIIAQAGTNTGSITVTGTKTASSITFAPDVGPTALITGGTIVIGGTGSYSGIRQQSSGANSIASAITLNSLYTAFNFSNSSTGLLTISGAVTGGASATQTVTVGSSSDGDITFSAGISNGSGGTVALDVNSAGAGVITLSGAKTFSGGLTVTAGTLRATANAGALGLGTLTLNGGILDLAETTATNFARNTTVGGNAKIISQRDIGSNGNGVTHTLGTLGIGANTLTVQGGDTVTGGTAGITFGTTTFSGNATFDVLPASGGGNTLLTLGALDDGGSGRTLTKNGGGNLTWGAITLSGAHNWTVNGGTLTSSGIIGGVSGSIAKNGAATLVLSGANSFAGGLVIKQGTVSATTSTSALGGSGTGAVTLGDSTVGLGATLLGDGRNFANAVTLASGSTGTLTIGNSANAAIFSGGVSGDNGFTIANNGATNTITFQTVNLTNTGLITNTGTSTGATTISSNITAATGVIQNSSGSLVLGGTNSYSGGTELNAGQITVTADSNLGDLTGDVTFSGNATLSGAVTYNAGRTFIINPSVLATISGAATIEGQVTGSGGIVKSSAGILTLSATNNNFTGPISISSGELKAASLSDGTGDGAITLNGSGLFSWTGGAQTFDDRQFVLAGTGQINNMNTGAGALTISNNIGFSGTGTRLLRLSANLGSQLTLSGAITDNDLATSVEIKSGTTGANANGGTVALSGTNTYSGTTTISTNSGAGNTLSNITIFQGKESLSPNTSVSYSRGNSGFFETRFLDDGAGMIDRSTTNFTHTTTGTPVFFVGNNNTVNGGNSAGTTTGSTFALGNLTSGTSGLTYDITGANGYKLQFNDVNLPTVNGAVTAKFNPTTASLIIAGTVRQASSVNTGAMTLTLGGSATANAVNGNILNSADGSPRLLNISKSGSSTWTLSGTNSYTGTTAISGGILRFTGDSSTANGAVTVTAGALGGNGGSLGGAVTVSSTGGINLADGAVGNLTLGSTLAITGAAGANRLTFDLGAAAAGTDKIIAGDATSVTTDGAAVISLNQLGGAATRLNAGTYTLIQGTTSMAALSKFALATTKAFGQTFTLGVTGNNLTLTTAQVTGVVLANTTLAGSGPSWQDTTKFDGGAVPDYASNVIINSAIGTSPLNGSTNINSLTYGTSATTATTISAGTPATSMLVIEAGAVNGNAAGNGITLNNTSGTHTISANIGLAASQTWTVATGGTLLISGTVSDFGAGYGLTKAGGGLLDIRANTQTYSGTTTVTGGAILLNGNLPGGNLTLNGGVYTGYNNTGLTRSLGSGVGQIQITGGISGFSGYGASTFTITGVGSAPLVWGSTHFAPSEFLLQDALVNANPSYKATFTNNIDLSGANRTVKSTMTSDIVTGGGFLSGNLSNSTGTAGLIKTGVGQIGLSGTNTYNGGTTISEGILRFDTLASMPATGAVSVASGATLGIGVASTGTTWGGGTGNGGIAGLVNSGLGGQAGSTVSFASGNSNLLLNVTGITTESNAITNGGATNLKLIIIGNSTLTLSSGSNSYSGGTTLSAGTLGVGSATAVPSTGTITFNGGTIQSSDATLRTFTNVIAVTGNPTVGTTGNLTFSDTGTVALGASRTFTVNGGTTTFAQSFTGTSNTLTKAGAGTLVLSGTNTGVTGGTTLSGGTLILAGATALPAGAITFNTSSTTLEFQNTANTSFSNAWTAGAQSINNTLVVNRPSVSAGAAVNLEFTQQYNRANGAVFNFQKGANITSGTPTITFSGGFTNTDSVNGALSGSGTTAPNTFNPTGVNLVINGIASSARTRGYIFQGDTTGNRLTGTFANGTGTSIRKAGTGTWTFAGTSLYTGTTEITGGTLALGANNILPDASAISIGAATLDAATFDDSAGTLNATGAATINLGSGANLAFLNSSGVTGGVWAGALNITGTFVSGDDTNVGNPGSIRFGVDNTGLTASQLADITVNGSGTYTLDAYGYLKAGSVGSSAYDTWKAANAPSGDPDDDYDGDGVSNAVEFVLGGTSLTKDLDKLPAVSTSGTDMVFTFKRAQSSIDPKTGVTIEVGTDLVTWPAPSPYAVPNVDTGGVINPGVTVQAGVPATFDTVTLRVPQAPDAKKFARLKVVITP